MKISIILFTIFLIAINGETRDECISGSNKEIFIENFVVLEFYLSIL